MSETARQKFLRNHGENIRLLCVMSKELLDEGDYYAHRHVMKIIDHSEWLAWRLESQGDES